MITFFKRTLGVVVSAVIMLAVVYGLHVVQESFAAPRATTVTVTIPEGATVDDIDRILAANGVIQPGALIAAANEMIAGSPSSTLEGRLFPDTYDFYVGSSASSVAEKFLDNFNAKAVPLFTAAGINVSSTAGAAMVENDLIIASIIQKEAPSSTDEAIIAGIIDKRLAQNIYLDFDTTICYIKEQEAAAAAASPAASSTLQGSSTCSFLSRADFKIDSPYNTYTHKGLPPTPIGNPGAGAIEASLHPQASPYLYYLSDPATGKIIYATTLAEQNANQAKYLKE